MGTTRTAIDAGSTRLVYVACIEGYNGLLCSGSTTAALTAWSGEGFTVAIPNLTVDMTHEQGLNPEDPFASSGGTCTLSVLPDAADTFGIDTAKRTAGAETYLDATLDRNDTTVTVKSTAAFASSGYIHIGTECISYSGKTATTFTDCVRGVFSGVECYNGNFTHDHRVGAESNGVNLQPVVSELPRRWIGRWVEVWAHRVVADVLDVKAQAERVFAGRIVEMRDDANTGARVLRVEHVMSTMKDIVIGANMWEGSADNTVYIAEGSTFAMRDEPGSETPRTATPLVVVASGASGPYQMSAGHYTHTQIATVMTTWLTAARAANTLWSHFTVTAPYEVSGAAAAVKEYVCQISWTVTGAPKWTLSMPFAVVEFLGFASNSWITDNAYPGNYRYTLSLGSATTAYWGEELPKFSVFANGSAASRFLVTAKTGALVDQYTALPANIRPPSNVINGTTYRWGLFMLGDAKYVVAGWQGDTPSELEWARVVLTKQGEEQDAQPERIALGDQNSNALILRQVFALEGVFFYLLPTLLMSTGTSGFNLSNVGFLSINYDAYPTGAGIPNSIFATNFLYDCTKLPGADGLITVMIDRPTKLSELISSDLLMRWAFFVWRDGGLTVDCWKTPSAENATVTLNESNKAEPSGNPSNPRSATTETSQWQRTINKVRYNRDATDPKGDKYRNTLTFYDRVAVDDGGGEGDIGTISLRNVYSEFGGGGQTTEQLLAGHMALLPLISRPANIVRRSIDLRFFLSISVGDTVLFTDSFARDPATGRRGVTDRPALVVRHYCTLGGSQLGSDSAAVMTGEVDLFFSDQDTDRLSPVYAPTADIDSTYDTGDYDGGYNSVTNTIRVHEHRYSESSEAVDASHFVAGDKVLIIERDPIDATAPTSWERTVGSISSSDITLTAALSSPAWNPDLSYRVTFQEYDTAGTTQRAKAYQADETDGLIIDTAQPYMYGSGTADPTYTAEVAAAEIELVPSVSYGDGFARDTGHESTIGRLANNLLDYKGTERQPMLFNSIVSNFSFSTGYLLVAYWPIFLGYEIPSSALFRYLSVAPMACSSDGSSVSMKIGLWRYRPNPSTLHNLPSPDNLVNPYASATFSGVTSTTMAVLAAQQMSINIKHPLTGRAWLVMELGYKCRTYGIAKLHEGARTSS